MGDDSSLLLTILHKTFYFQERCLLKSNFMALFCGLEKPSQMDWLADETLVKFMAVNHIS